MSVFRELEQDYGIQERKDPKGNIIVTVPNITHGEDILEIEWWSRHILSNHQKYVLACIYKMPLRIIHRDIFFEDPAHFLECFETYAPTELYVVAPQDCTEYAQKHGKRFHRFAMDRYVYPSKQRVRLVYRYDGLDYEVIFSASLRALRKKELEHAVSRIRKLRSRRA